jgi:hypothetical protein
MPTQRLQDLLSKLKEEVASLAESSELERERLESLIKEIQLSLEQDDSADHASLIDGLRNKLGEFENDHPTASGVARRLMQALGDMGI